MAASQTIEFLKACEIDSRWLEEFCKSLEVLGLYWEGKRPYSYDSVFVDFFK